MSGSVSISIEVELGWGVHDRGIYEHLSPDGVVERRYLGQLLDWCEAVDVPVTFDVVGHLLLDSCKGTHSGPYTDGWFDADPGTGPEGDGRFYAPDIVEQVVASPVAHELCSHTFSHTVASLPREMLAADLDRAQRLYETTFGDRPVSFVPPRHQPPPSELLVDNGIEVVRIGKRTGSGSRVGRLRELLYGPVPTWENQLCDGVVETYCTTYPSLVAASLPHGQRLATHPVFSLLPVRLRERLHRHLLSRTLDHVAATGDHVNLWCHLFDFSNEYQWPLLSAFLGELARRRDAGEVDVLTLADLNDRVRRTAELAVTV